jgi:hypothetical protein
MVNNVSKTNTNRRSHGKNHSDKNHKFQVNGCSRNCIENFNKSCTDIDASSTESNVQPEIIDEALVEMMNGFETGKLAKFSSVNWCCSLSIASVSSLPGEHRTGSPEALVRSDTAAAAGRGQQSPGDDVTPPIMLDFDSFRWSKGKPRTRYRVVTDSTDDDSDDLEPASSAAGGGTNGRRRLTRQRLEPPLSQTTPVTRSSSRISQKQ